MSAGAPRDVLFFLLPATPPYREFVFTVYIYKHWNVNNLTSRRAAPSGIQDPKVQNFRIVQVGTTGMAHRGGHGNMMDGVAEDVDLLG